MGGKKMKEKRKDRKVCLKSKFFHYKDKKIAISQYQKAGYEKILKFLVKGIPWR